MNATFSILCRFPGVSGRAHLRVNLNFRSMIVLSLLCLCLQLRLYGQSPSPPLPLSDVGPETGFLSPSKYTNAFFGFSIFLPQDAGLREQTLSLNRGTRDHLLIGFHSPSKNLVSFKITARELGDRSGKEARNSAAGPDSSKPRETEIAGRTFWKSASPKTVTDHNMQTLIFSTAINGYVLQFEVVSFNPEITAEIERDIEKVRFFDPSAARAMAGPDSQPYIPGASQFSANRIAQLSAGSISGNVYRNEQLGFRYEFPQGWVLMSKTTQTRGPEGGHEFIWGNSPSVQKEHEEASQCSRDLLFVTRYLEDPTPGKFNARVLLVVGDPKCAPGSRFPKSVDDREAIQQIARQFTQYFKAVGMPWTEPARVRAFNNGDRLIIEILQSSAQGQSGPASIFSSLLLMEAGDYWVMWMFEAGDKQELEELRNTRIFFDAPRSPNPPQ